MSADTVDLARGDFLSLGQLARVIADNKPLNDFLKGRLRPADFVAVTLPPVLQEIADLRNPVAHTERLGRERIAPLRDRLVGVGCAGRLVQLGAVRLL